MSPCYICGSPEVASCKSCGKLICGSHLETIRNVSVCPECAIRFRKQMKFALAGIPIVATVIILLIILI